MILELFTCDIYDPALLICIFVQILKKTDKEQKAEQQLKQPKFFVWQRPGFVHC